MKKLFATLLACAMTFTCVVPAFAAEQDLPRFYMYGYRGIIEEPLDVAWIDSWNTQVTLDTIEDVTVVEKGSIIEIKNIIKVTPDYKPVVYTIFMQVFQPKALGLTAPEYDPDTETITIVDISDYMTSIDFYNLLEVEKDTHYEIWDIPFDDTKYWKNSTNVCFSSDSYTLRPGQSIDIKLPDLGDGYVYAIGIYDGHERYWDYITDDENIGTKESGNTANNNKAEAAVKPSNFKDVADNAYYADAVKWAVENGITSGTSETTFSPNNTCTRAQILTFLWKANGSLPVSGENPFTDVKESDYYYNAAKWAHALGIIEGKTFAGNTPCTRSSTVEYMYKSAGSPDVAVTDVFTDVSANADYAKAVAWALENGITGGTSDTTFSPDNTCTRGQIVSFLYRNYAD